MSGYSIKVQKQFVSKSWLLWPKYRVFSYTGQKKETFLIINSYLPLTLLGFEPGQAALYVEGLQGQWHRAGQQFWGLEEPILKI